MSKIGLMFVCGIVIAGLWAFDLRCAFACSCVPPGPPAQERDAASAVFVGKVIAVDAPNGNIVSSGDAVKVTFQVSQVWKGPAEPTLMVTTARDSASCGYEFARDQEYLVYARGTETRLEASLCGRTQPLADAGEDIAQLGVGTKLEDTSAAPPANVPGDSGPQTDSPGAAGPSTGEARPSALPIAAVLSIVGLGALLIIGGIWRLRWSRR